MLPQIFYQHVSRPCGPSLALIKNFTFFMFYVFSFIVTEKCDQKSGGIYRPRNSLFVQYETKGTGIFVAKDIFSEKKLFPLNREELPAERQHQPHSSAHKSPEEVKTKAAVVCPL